MGKIADIWNGAAFLIKASIVLAVLVVALIFLDRLKPEDDSYKEPKPDGYEEYHEATPSNSIPESQVPALPYTKPDHVRGRVTVTTRDSTHTALGKDTVITHHIEVFIPTDDKPPVVRGDSNTQITYAEVREPFVGFKPGLLIGGTVNLDLQPSIFGGVLVFQAFKHLDIGAGVDRNGLGPLAGWEFWREFTAFGQYDIIAFGADKHKTSIGLAYRF